MLETLREDFGIFKTMRSVGKNESGKFGGLRNSATDFLSLKFLPIDNPIHLAPSCIGKPLAVL